jgi:hypothetical protein
VLCSVREKVDQRRRGWGRGQEAPPHIYTTKKKCGRDKVCEYPATFTYMFTAECEKHPGQSSHHNGKYK